VFSSSCCSSYPLFRCSFFSVFILIGLVSVTVVCGWSIRCSLSACFSCQYCLKDGMLFPRCGWSALPLVLCISYCRGTSVCVGPPSRVALLDWATTKKRWHWFVHSVAGEHCAQTRAPQTSTINWLMDVMQHHGSATTLIVCLHISSIFYLRQS
jgi:hypothetical protein